MKKKIIALFLVVFTVAGVLFGSEKVYAQDFAENVKISDVLTENSLVGYSQNQTRGAYLARGYSIINDAGGGKIGCGGITEAAKKCKVKILCVLERKEGSSWVRVTSWSDEKANAYSASVSKYYPVGSGYYYRIRSTHYASSDVSNSFTSGLWM